MSEQSPNSYGYNKTPHVSNVKSDEPRSDRYERQDRHERVERPNRSDRQERVERPDRSDRQERVERPNRSERPERSDQPDRFERSDRLDRPRGDRPRFERSDEPRDFKKKGEFREKRRPRLDWQDEVAMLDQELIELIVKRNRVLSKIPDEKLPTVERDLRVAWEKKTATQSRDPRFIRQMFALLQAIEVAPTLVETSAFNLAPTIKPLDLELPAPTCSKTLRAYLSLITSCGLTGNFTGITLGSPVMECLRAFNQLGASLRYEEDGQILCRQAPPTAGYTKSVLDKVIHIGDDPFNLYLVIFQLITRPSRVKLVGESNLKLGSLTCLRHFLTQLGARLTHVVPGQDGLPARLETSAILPDTVSIPADLPADAVLALILAGPSFSHPLTLDLAGHPDAISILAQAQAYFKACNLELVQDQLTLTLQTGTPSFPEKLALDTTTAFYYLLMPYILSGKLTFKGNWAFSELQALLQLLPSAEVKITDTELSLTIANAEPSPIDLNSLSPALLPLGLIFNLIPVLRARSGSFPTLPEHCNLETIDLFMQSLGLVHQEAALNPAPQTVWTSSDFVYSLALTLAAFIKPQLKLGNPAAITQEIPYFWYIYNGQHQPESMIPAPEVKPQRRRIIGHE